MLLKRILGIISTISVCFITTACTNNNATANNKEAIKTSVEAPIEYEQIKKLKVQNKALYHPIFIEALSDMNKAMTLENNYIISNKDTIYFPEDLKLNKKYNFQATAATGSIFELSVTRTNLTDLDYSFVLKSGDGNIINEMNGVALLLPKGMFRDNEIEEDELDEMSYPTFEYYNSFPDHCIFIRIGTELDNNGKYRAKVYIESETEEVLGLKDGPTLRAI